MKIKPAKKEPPPDRDEMIARVKTLVRESRAHTVSRRELEAVTGIKDHHVRRHFGSHSALIRACGLTPYSRQLGASDEDLLTAMHEAFTAAGGVLGGKRFESTCRYGRQAYKSRWRRWSSALSAYRVWLEAHHPDSPLLPALAASSLPDDEVIAWEACGGARFGAPLPLPGLQHAPTNKMGVVFLFGALAPALGYTVESLGTAFPDCVAKRRLQGPGEPWERVRVEFEYRSRNFLSHKHDPKGCDVIVCWDHDWLECPLDVVELKREVTRLTKPSAV